MQWSRRGGQGQPSDDFDGKVFQISIDRAWDRFRTVMHIGQVYGQGYLAAASGMMKP